MTKQAGDYIDNLRAQLEGARNALVREEARSRRLTQERDNARTCARVLAHAYTTDNRPPASAVDEALAFPANPKPERASKWQKGEPVVEVKGQKPHYQALEDANQRAAEIVGKAVEALAESKHPACLSDCRAPGCGGGCSQ